MHHAENGVRIKSKYSKLIFLITRAQYICRVLLSYPLLHPPALLVLIALVRIAAMSRLHEAEGKPPVAQF